MVYMVRVGYYGQRVRDQMTPSERQWMDSHKFVVRQSVGVQWSHTHGQVMHHVSICTDIYTFSPKTDLMYSDRKSNIWSVHTVKSSFNMVNHHIYTETMNMDNIMGN